MPVRWLAASFSVSRATAPARRSLSKLSAMAVDPPVACRPRSLIAPPATSRMVSAANPSSVERKGTASSAMAVFQ
jgi:hypothetical protein